MINREMVIITIETLTDRVHGLGLLVARLHGRRRVVLLLLVLRPRSRAHRDARALFLVFLLLLLLLLVELLEARTVGDGHAARVGRRGQGALVLDPAGRRETCRVR